MAKKKTTTSKKTKAPRKKISFSLSKQQKILLGSFLFFLGIALIFSFVSYFFTWQADQSAVGNLGERELVTKNWLNKFGTNVGHFFIYDGFGVAAFSFAFLIALTGVYFFFDYTKKQLKRFWFWGILVMVWTSVLLGFFTSKNSLLSGVTGYEINDLLQDYLGLIGAIFVMAFLLIVYLVLRLKITPEKVGLAFKKTKKEIISDFSVDSSVEDSDKGSEEIKIVTETTSVPTETIKDLSEEKSNISARKNSIEVRFRW